MYFRPYFLHEMSSSPSTISRCFTFNAISAVSISRGGVDEVLLGGLFVSPAGASPRSVSDPAFADPTSADPSLRDPSHLSRDTSSPNVSSRASSVRSPSFVVRRKRDTARTMRAGRPRRLSGRSPVRSSTRAPSSETSSSTSDITTRSFVDGDRATRLNLSRRARLEARLGRLGNARFGNGWPFFHPASRNRKSERGVCV